MSGAPSSVMSRNSTDSPQSRGGAVSGFPSVSRKAPSVQGTGVKCPFPSFKNNRVPPPIELTSKSRSPSPSTSASTAPVEYCPGHCTPAGSVISSNRQPPRFRYNRFPPSMPQKYKSHQPSPSTSP